MEKGCLHSTSNDARRYQLEWGLSGECNPHKASCAVWLLFPCRTELECFFLCKSRGDLKGREPDFLMQNFNGSPVSSSPRRKLTGVFSSVFLNWYVLLKWLPRSYVQTNKKSLPGKNLSSKGLELCSLSPLLIKIVKNLEAVCKSKIITEPQSFKLLQAVEAADIHPPQNLLRPTGKFLSYLQFSTNVSKIDDEYTRAVLHSRIRCERKFLLIWKQTWKLVPFHRR